MHGQSARFQIERTPVEDINGPCMVLHFTGKTRGFALDGVNKSAIIAMYGPDPAGWIGKAITLVPKRMNVSGDLAIRVKLESERK